MDVRRRDLLKWGIFHTALMTLPIRTRADEVFANERRSRPSVLQGLTDANRTEFSVVHRSGLGLRAQVLDELGQLRGPVLAENLSLASQPHELRRFHFEGLSPGVDYRLQLVTPDGHLADERAFQTRDPQKEAVKFAVCSCMDDSRHEPEI